MSVPAPSRRKFRFGRFEADLETGELRKAGRTLRLQDKSFQILAALLEKCGQLVTRDELRRRLWGEDTFVDVENGLNTAVSKLREVLGEAGHCVETLSRRGYRFSGQVEELGPRVASSAGRNLLVEVKHLDPDIVVVEIAGRIVLGPECNQIEWLISDLLAKNERKIVFDLSGVTHIDSTGIGILVVCSAKTSVADGKLCIAGATGIVEHTLTITHLDRILLLHATVAAAAEQFAADHAPDVRSA